MTALVKFVRTAVWLAFGALLLAGCVPTSENPIAAKSGAADPALAGTWHGKTDDGTPLYIHFLPTKDGAFTALLIPETGEPPEKADKADWSVFRIVTAEVKGTRYISALWDLDGGKPVEAHEKGYHLMRYAIGADGSLRIFMVDEAKLIQAVKDGKVEGKVEGEGSTAPGSGDVRLTASSEKLIKFLKRAKPEDLFDKPFATLSKQKP
jgi:hypothetical protein